MVIFIAFGFNLSALILFENLSSNLKTGIETQCNNIETNRICIYGFHVKPKPFRAWKLKAMQACNWKRQKPKRFAGGCFLYLFVVSCPKCMVSWLVLWAKAWNCCSQHVWKPCMLVKKPCRLKAKPMRAGLPIKNNEASKAKHLRLAESSQCSLQANRNLNEACKTKSMKLAARSQWGLQAKANEACN